MTEDDLMPNRFQSSEYNQQHNLVAINTDGGRYSAAQIICTIDKYLILCSGSWMEWDRSYLKSIEVL